MEPHKEKDQSLARFFNIVFSNSWSHMKAVSNRRLYALACDLRDFGIDFNPTRYIYESKVASGSLLLGALEHYNLLRFKMRYENENETTGSATHARLSEHGSENVKLRILLYLLKNKTCNFRDFYRISYPKRLQRSLRALTDLHLVEKNERTYSLTVIGISLAELVDNVQQRLMNNHIFLSCKTIDEIPRNTSTVDFERFVTRMDRLYNRYFTSVYVASPLKSLLGDDWKNSQFGLDIIIDRRKKEAHIPLLLRKPKQVAKSPYGQTAELCGLKIHASFLGEKNLAGILCMFYHMATESHELSAMVRYVRRLLQFVDERSFLKEDPHRIPFEDYSHPFCHYYRYLTLYVEAPKLSSDIGCSLIFHGNCISQSGHIKTLSAFEWAHIQMKYPNLLGIIRKYESTDAKGVSKDTITQELRLGQLELEQLIGDCLRDRAIYEPVKGFYRLLRG